MKKSAVITFLLSSVLTGFGASLLAGCAADSPKLVPLPMAKPERIRDQGGVKVSFSRSVDILFVVDDSGSMSTHQSNLSKNIGLFTQGITSNQILDYHIGVLTSNMNEAPWNPNPGYGWKGELNGVTKYVTKATPLGTKELETNLMPGINGSGTEMFFEPVMKALTAPLVTGLNAGFYRSSAYLAVIFVTDSDDQSQNSAKDFHDFLLRQKGNDPDKILTYGAFIPSADTVCYRSSEPQPQKIEEFFALTKGKTFGLCDQDFGVKLAELGEDIVKRIGTHLFLSRPAQPDTIVVTYGSQTIPNDSKKGWIYDPVRNALLFGEEIDLLPEPAGTEVTVDFVAATY